MSCPDAAGEDAGIDAGIDAVGADVVPYAEPADVPGAWHAAADRQITAEMTTAGTTPLGRSAAVAGRLKRM